MEGLKGLLNRLPTRALELLRLSIGGGGSVALRRSLGVPPSTFHEYVTTLERVGLLVRERGGRSYQLKPTSLGRLIAKALLQK